MPLGAPDSGSASNTCNSGADGVSHPQPTTLLELLALASAVSAQNSASAPAPSTLNSGPEVTEPPSLGTSSANFVPLPTPSDKLPSPPSTKSYEVLIKFNQPRTKAGARKNVKLEARQFGPFNATVDLGWDNFLSVLADEILVAKRALGVPSLRWRWMKPANSPELPLTSQAGYASMIKQVNARADPYIFVFMDPPTPTLEAQSPYTRPIDVTDDEIQDSSPKRKPAGGRLDARIASLSQELHNTYMDKCADHPGQSCFHYRPTNLHFLLDSDKQKVWANGIILGNASITKPPLGSNFFSAAKATPVKKKNEPVEQAGMKAHVDGMAATGSVAPTVSMEKTAKPPAAAPVMTLCTPTHPHMPSLPATPTAVYQPPFHFGYVPTTPVPPSAYHLSTTPYASPTPYPPGYYSNFQVAPTPFPAHAVFPPVNPNLHPELAYSYSHLGHVQGNLRHMPHSTTDERSSPPPPPTASVEDMCNRHHLGPEIFRRLTELRFEIGDNLDVVKKDMWEDVGFNELEWDRVKTAYKRYKRSF